MIREQGVKSTVLFECDDTASKCASVDLIRIDVPSEGLAAFENGIESDWRR